MLAGVGWCWLWPVDARAAAPEMGGPRGGGVVSGSCGPFAGRLAECGDFINWSMGCCVGMSLVGAR
jgi:hypothetical protein